MTSAPASYYLRADALLAHQVREVRTPGTFGGILCPLCPRIHGRSAARHSPGPANGEDDPGRALSGRGNPLQAWSDHVGRSAGSWVNEAVGNDWKGITVFGLLAHAEALRHHGALLDAKVRRRWEERLARAACFVFDLMQISTGNRGRVEIDKPGGRLQVTWNAPETGTDPSTRIFHPVPGFQALPLAWELFGDPLAVSIRPV